MILSMLKKYIYLLSYMFIATIITQGILCAAEEWQDLDSEVNFRAFSSEVSQASIGNNIFEIVRTAQTSIIIASDQCTNKDFLDKLLELRNVNPELNISIVIGDDTSHSRRQSILRNPLYECFERNYVPAINGAKMHNKFIVVDDKIVITGSPNLTHNAYNKNVESFVSIENRSVALLYHEYYKYIIDQEDDVQRNNVITLMKSWNNRSNSLQVCLAPLTSISEFIIERIVDVNVVDISMFLISRATQPEGDIVSHLFDLGDIVTIKVDSSQYNMQEFMRTAIGTLVDSGVHVSTVYKNNSILHDKLMLISYQDGTKKVIIGSAGFTTNVQDNLNFENMVSITNHEIYNFLLEHFNSIQNREGRNGPSMMVTKLQ